MSRAKVDRISTSRLMAGCALALTALAMSAGNADARPRNNRANQPQPVAGPVVSLTKAAQADELMGADVRGVVTDPLAVRVLIDGAPIAPPSGRADNFFLTPEAAIAAHAAMPDLEVRSTAVPEPFTTAAAPARDDMSAARQGEPPEQRGKQVAVNLAHAAAAALPHVRTPLPRVRPAPPRPHRRQVRATFDPFGLFR